MSRVTAGYNSRPAPNRGARASLYRAWPVLLTVVTPAFAVEGNVGVALGAQYSDNVTLAPEGEEESSWMTVGTLSLEVGDRSNERELRVASSLDYVNYASETFRDEFLFSMNGTGLWRLSDATNWHAEDYFNRATVDPLAAPVPSNQQDVNVFSTGPETRIPMGRAHVLVAGARYENFYYETSDTGSQRLGGYGRWLYAMDPRRDLSVNVELSGTDFKSERYPDLRRADAFLRLANRWPRASVELDGGATSIQRDGVEDVNGALGRLGWHMPFNSRHGVDLYITHQYTDVGTYLLDSTTRGDAVGAPETAQVTGDVFYNRQTELAYHWRGMFSSLRVAGAVRDEDYRLVPADRRQDEGTIGFGYEVAENMLAAVYGVYRRSDYLQLNQVNTERTGILTLTYKINSRLSANFQVAHDERESNYAPAEFRENRVFVSVGYNQTANPGRLPGKLTGSVDGTEAFGVNGTETVPATDNPAGPSTGKE